MAPPPRPSKGEGPRHTGQLACDVDVKLHLRMDAAEHEKGARDGKADFHHLARLLGAGPESKSSAGPNIRLSLDHNLRRRTPGACALKLLAHFARDVAIDLRMRTVGC